jgi:outer membrane protein TolC
VLTLQAALQFALKNNPALNAQRKQLGIASARIVIADTYPFNPVFENRVQVASGPISAGVTNKVPLEHLLLWEVEVRGQGQIRRQGAAAAFSKTEWEIARMEQTLAVDVMRAYTALLYRQEKLQLLEETLRLNERLVDDVKRLIDLGKQKPSDLILAQSEVTNSQDAVLAGMEAVTTARQDLNRVLGAVSGEYRANGVLDVPPWKWEGEALDELALARRADLKALQKSVEEASANCRLTAANRYGNPSVGTVYSYDPSRVSSIGIQVNVPLPIVNSHAGEMSQSRAELILALNQLQSAEVNVKLDVTAALARLVAAERRTASARTTGLPNSKRAVEDIEKLFLSGEPGVDAIKVIEVRRNFLKYRDGYLDALWSVRQARIDVSAATGEPALELAKPVPPLVPEKVK